MAPSDLNGPLPRMDLKPTTAKMIRTVTPLRIAGVLVDLFTRVGQRPPPSATKSQHVRFISIAVSNYVEKVRWGLDLLEESQKSPVYYTEDLHPPAFAAFQSVPASNDQASQSPMVVLPDGRAIWDSEKILQELCADPSTVNLYPENIADEVKQLEAELGTRLGASARCFGYYCLLAVEKSKTYYGAASKFLTLHCPTAEQTVFDKLFDRGLAKGMIRLMKVHDFGEASEQEIRTVFDEMSARLEANGGAYLMGNEFTAADLTLGALSYFILRPPEMQPFFLTEEELPPKLVKLGEDLRETLAGKHVLKMYQQHRPVDATTNQIALKKVNQNRTPWMEMAGAATVLGAVTYGFFSLKS